MLEFRNVTVNIGQNTIVKDVYFTAETGKITVLLGKNGSGKSTLIRAANGLVRFDGTILFDGRVVTPTERARLAAFLPQSVPQTELSVRDVVALGRHPYTGLTGKLGLQDRAVIEECITRLELEPLQARRCNSLSGGERQRVFLAMLLAQQTPLLIMDEPSTFMDVDAAGALDTLCDTLRGEGKTVLMVMHDLNRALALADRVVLLENGRVCFVGSREECLAQQMIEQHFGVHRVTAENHIFFTSYDIQKTDPFYKF